MASPSPAVTVQDGGAAAQNNPPFDVTAGNVVTVALVSVAGVSSWGFQLFGQDDKVTPPAVTVNNTTKVATFTAPTAPWTLIYKSIVNNGVDVNGVVQPSYTTTVGIHALTANSKRLVASNETAESNTTLGWTQKVNDAARPETANVQPWITADGATQLDFAQDFTTTNGTPFTVTFTIPPSRSQKFIGMIEIVDASQNVKNYWFDDHWKRIGAASPVRVGTSVAPRDLDGASTQAADAGFPAIGGYTVTSSGVSVLLTCTGLAATNLTWMVRMQRMQGGGA